MMVGKSITLINRVHKVTSKSLITAGLALICAGTAWGALTPDEVKQLGTTLTPLGAEKAGNKDGSIPAYSGGLTTAPAGFKKGSGVRPDPFADEKPLFSVNAKNMAQYADKLTEGVKTLMKKYPGYRIDVYKTHRTAAYPKWVNDNTIKSAGKASTSSDGNTIKNAHACYPFPIPKSGAEAMWNHLLKFGPTERGRGQSYVVDANGRAIMASESVVEIEYPYWDTKKTSIDYYRFLKLSFKGPARRAGEGILKIDPLNTTENPVRAWLYLPGQRRVKLAPDLGHDAPDAATSGATTFDDNFVFNGSLERFSWKLVGKKEMYVPYNSYKMAYHSKPAELYKPNHLNPDYVRWELHRVWVVEATLKPGKRHIYHKRTFYLDEDSWAAVASDQYDGRGQMYRAGFVYITPSYDYPAPLYEPFGHYDLLSSQYNLNAYTGPTGGVRYIAPLPEKEWTPDSLAGSGVR